MVSYQSLVNEVKSCSICQDHLPLGPRPVLQFHPDAKILIVGQAPGRKVHESGVPFDDASGNRLREWLGITSDIFYDPKLVSILPMGFCYPGSKKSGDLPPRPECATAWRKPLLEKLHNVELTLLIGQYAQTYHFGKTGKTLTDLVKSWDVYWPNVIPLPHPSPRNNIWLRKNPWFEVELLPNLKKRVASVLS